MTEEKFWTVEQELIRVLGTMTFEERVRFLVKYAHAHRLRQKMGKRVPPRFWGNRTQGHRLLED